MKVVLLAGGFGTRLAEYTESIPKPMVPIGGRPILWHIMQQYAAYGHKDFYLALGYKAQIVKEFSLFICFIGFCCLSKVFHIFLQCSGHDQVGYWRSLPDDPRNDKKPSKTIQQPGICRGVPRPHRPHAETSSGRSPTNPKQRGGCSSS